MMEVKQISSRCYRVFFNPSSDGMVFSSFVIVGKNKIFIADTGSGSADMMFIKQHFASELAQKKVVVCNSHSHWDHVWGNNCFADSTIIAHSLCYKELQSSGELARTMNKDQASGDNTLLLPNILITGNWYDASEQVLIFPSSGHTNDSLSVYDEVDQVLFVADNMELPLPSIDSDSVESYIQTIQFYKSLSVKQLVASHNENMPIAELDRLLAYLNEFDSESPSVCTTDQMIKVHDSNRKLVLFNKYVEKIRTQNSVSLEEFFEVTSPLFDCEYSQVQEILRQKYGAL